MQVASGTHVEAILHAHATKKIDRELDKIRHMIRCADIAYNILDMSNQPSQETWNAIKAISVVLNVPG